MAHLTNAQNLKSAGFEISAHLDNAKIEVCINEAEQIHIKPRITDALYIDLLKYIAASDKMPFPTKYETLLNGGEWENENNCCNAYNSKRQFDGLINAVNYYSYARLIKRADDNTTRFGFMQKTDEHSTHPDPRIKQAAYDDALHTADIFMSDVIAFLEENKADFPLFKKAGIAKNRFSMKVIK